MKKWILIGIIAALAVTLRAEAPEMFRYQGRLVNGTNLVNATLPMSFKLYDAQSGGTQLYEDSNSVLVVDGLYSTYIGDNTVLGSLISAVTNAAVYLELTVNGETLSPRERLVSVPYALNSGSSTRDITQEFLDARYVLLTGSNITSSVAFRNMIGAASAENTVRTDGSNITNAEAFRAAIGVERSVFPSLRMWAKAPLQSESIGIIGDSTGSGYAWPLALYNLICTNFPSITVKYFEYNSATANSDFKSIRLGSDGELRATPTSGTFLTGFTRYDEMTNSFDIAVRCSLSDWTANQLLFEAPAASPIFVNKKFQTFSKYLYFYFAANGASLTNASTGPITVTNNQPLWVRVTGDIVGGEAIIKFYSDSSAFGTNWIQVGATKTNAGVSAFDVPAVSSTMYSRIGTTVYEMRWSPLIGGQNCAPPIDHWIPNTKTNVTFAGSPVFEIHNGSWPGAAFATWTTPLIKKALPYHTKNVIVNLGLNETGISAYTYVNQYSKLATLSDSIATSCPNAFLCTLSQNPFKSDQAQYRYFPVISRQIMAAAKKQGHEVIDNYSHFLDSGWDDTWLKDTVHPTWASQQVNGLYIYQNIFE